MALSKKDRRKVYEKSNGFCWYCGCDISQSKWQADHLEPIYRGWNEKPSHAGKDTIENLVPACAKCNNHKKTFSVEDFRREISLQVERARKTSANFRNAERFGMIEVKSEPIVFWFEKKNYNKLVVGERSELITNKHGYDAVGMRENEQGNTISNYREQF